MSEIFVQSASAIFPVGLALFDQGAETLLRIFKFVELVEKNIHGVLQAFPEGEAHASENGFFGHGQNGTGMRGDVRDEFVNGGIELGFRNQASDQTELKGAFGGNGFSGKDDFESALWSDEERKDGGSE